MMPLIVLLSVIFSGVFLYIVTQLTMYFYAKYSTYKSYKEYVKKCCEHIESNSYIFETAVNMLDEISDDKFIVYNELKNIDGRGNGISVENKTFICTIDNLGVFHILFGNYIFDIYDLKKYKSIRNRIKYKIDKVNLNKKLSVDKKLYDEVDKIKKDILN